MTAKETFKLIGYHQDLKKDYIIYYKLLKFGREVQIEFNFEHKTIEKRKIPNLESEPITLDEYVGIYKQIEELNWFSDEQKKKYLKKEE